MRQTALYIKEIYAQFVETNVLVKHNIYHEPRSTLCPSLSLTIKANYHGFRFADYLETPCICISISCFLLLACKDENISRYMIKLGSTR